MLLSDIQVWTGDSAAAAAADQALALFRDLGDRAGQGDALNGLGIAEALNSLGELASRTAATGQAREHHSQALVIASKTGAPLQEARALEGIGHNHLHDGNPRQAAVHLRHALAIYARIGAPDAQRIEETLRQHGP
jgi:hypothetical protein